MIGRDALTQDGWRIRDGLLEVKAINESEFEASSVKGEAFVLYSTYSATGGEEIIYLENEDSIRDIRIDYIKVSTTVAGIFSVIERTSGTAAGTVLTPLNVNLGSGAGSTADITAFGNASVTGTLAGDTLVGDLVGVAAPHKFEFEGGLIVPKNSAIFVTAAVSGIVHATILFHFASKTTL